LPANIEQGLINGQLSGLMSDLNVVLRVNKVMLMSILAGCANFILRVIDVAAALTLSCSYIKTHHFNSSRGLACSRKFAFEPEPSKASF